MGSDDAMPVHTVATAKAGGPPGKSRGSESFTIPEKIIHFLTEHMPDAYCDDCLAVVLNLRRTQVNTVTATLGLCREYSRGAQCCTTCMKVGKSATRRDSM